MAIYNGTNKIGSLFTGANKIGKMFNGSDSVFQKKLYLYNMGDECINKTGGWQVYARKETSSKNEVLPTYDSSARKITTTASSGTQQGVYEIINKINLTGYNKLHIIGSLYCQNTNGGLSLDIVGSRNEVLSDVVSYTPIYESTTKATVAINEEIDISNINGEYYIELVVQSRQWYGTKSATFTFNEMYLD